MPNTREKLIELLEETVCDCIPLEDLDEVVKHLIANGVTVQKWIPVTERLPEDDVLVLCIGARGGMFLGRSPSRFSDGSTYFAVPNARSCRYGTHWMPLPEPPQLEEN